MTHIDINHKFHPSKMPGKIFVPRTTRQTRFWCHMYPGTDDFSKLNYNQHISENPKKMHMVVVVKAHHDWLYIAWGEITCWTIASHFFEAFKEVRTNKRKRFLGER
jgi:hypothetical protein